VSEPRWLTSLSAVLLQLESLAEYGGSEGLRDESLLESALARARNLYNYEGVTDLARLAGAYAFGIARNHPFVDGNKRAAFMSIGLFLERNGHHLRAGKAAAARLMFGVASGDVEEEELASWIRENMFPGPKEKD
jgi:death on curing protein